MLRHRARWRSGFKGIGNASLLPGPIYDGFSGSGGIIGRVTESGGLTYQQKRYTGTGEAFAVASGLLTSIVTGNPFQAFGVVAKATGSGQLWTRRRIGNLNSGGTASATYVLADMVTIGSGVANWLMPRFGNITGAITSFGVAYANSSTITDIASSANMQHRAGDIIGARYRGRGTGTLEVAGYHNGQRITAWNVVNQTTNPDTGDFGHRASSTLQVDDFLVADPVNERVIDVICQGRVVQRDPSTGAVRPKFSAYFAPDIPAQSSLNYTYVDATTKAVITGHNQQPVTGLTSGTSIPAYDVDANNATMLPASLSSPPAGGFYVEIRRTDLLSGTSLGASPYLYPGDVYLTGGQSLLVQAVGATDGLVPSVAPVNCWRLDGSYDTTDQNAGGYARARTVRSSSEQAGSPMNQLFSTLQSANGGVPVMVITGGIGATTQWQRNNDSEYKRTRNLGLAMAGYGIRRFLLSAGQYEVAVPQNGSSPYGSGSAGVIAARQDFAEQVRLEMVEIDALCGTSVEVLMIPLTVVFNTPDADSQEFRRAQIAICDNNPTKYKLGPYTFLCERALSTDAQPPSDNYHFSKTITLTALTGLAGSDPHVQSGYGRELRAIGHSNNFHNGHTANDRNGPSLISARISGNNIICTFNLNGGTLAVQNTAYLGDFRCGLDFGSGPISTGFTTYLQPTSASVTATNEVTFGFASAPAAGTLVMAAHGSYPFCRTQNGKDFHTGGGTSGTTNAVYLHPAKRASMVCCTYTDAETAPVKPSINIGGAGVDYVVCS